MTKPIEWRGPTQTVPGELLRLRTMYEGENGYDYRDATPSDLVAALAAMGEVERAEMLQLVAERNVPGCVTVRVVREEDLEKLKAERDAAREERDEAREDARQSMAFGHQMQDERGDMCQRMTEATARAEKAEAEITEVRRVLGVRDNEVTASTAAWRMGEITAATVRAEKAERERDEAREEIGTLHVERQAVAAALGLLPGERIGEGRLSVAVRLACEERDELRVKNDGLRDCLEERKTICEDAIKRAIASESAAAQREEQTRDPLFRAHEATAAARPPREYPLAEGSPPPSIDPERLDLVRRALSGYVDPDQSPEQAARVAVEVADAALAIMRGLV